jgi:hypothetical protein
MHDRRPPLKGAVMIGKKMLSWIAAGLLSVATIPAVGATVSHHAKSHAKRAHAAIHRRSAVKSISHKTTARKLSARKGATKLVSRKVTKAHAAHRTHLVSAKHTATRLQATKLVGITSMHSGRSTALTKAVAAKAKPASHLLAATTTKKIH